MRLLTTFAAAAVAVGMASAPALAQQQEGLVNVNITDIGVQANVQVPIAVAANVCDVEVNLLARDIGPGETACDAEASAVADNEQFMRFAERQGFADAIRDAAGS